MDGSGVLNGGRGTFFLGPPAPADGQSLVLVGQQTGYTVIPQATPLTSLNYFDGKFLRAQDLFLEKQYLRALIAQTNQAGGAGVVDGLSAALTAGDEIVVSPGLAIGGDGRLIYLPIQAKVGVQQLIDLSQTVTPRPLPLVARAGPAAFAECVVQAPPQPTVSPGAEQYYLLTIGWAEALCGEENVFGLLCEDACATTSDHSFRVEGAVLRLRPLPLAKAPGTKSTAIHYDPRVHLRSLLASEVFAEEPAIFPSLISRAGLAADIWCFGALLSAGTEVPLAVLARLGGTTLFLDAWIARRERTEVPARRYWAWRMAMRPWDVFLAQILQFQCQLHDLILGPQQPGPALDPCAPANVAIDHANRVLIDLHDNYASILRQLPTNVAGQIEDIRAQLQGVLQAAPATAVSRILINGGILELPSAGYLPIDNSAQSLTVNEQSVRLLGEGLDLRVCVVRPDYVQHALEERQHMERISLLTGLDDPTQKPRVDILVPDGQLVNVEAVSPGRGFEAEVNVFPDARQAALVLTGAGRSDRAGSDGVSFTFAGTGQSAATSVIKTVATTIRGLATIDPATIASMTRAPISEQASAQVSPAFDMTISALSSAASSHLAGLRAPLVVDVAPGAGVAGIAFRPPPGVLATGDVSAFWLSVNIDRDLLSMKVGEATQVLLRVAGVSAVNGSVNENGQLSGVARVTDIATGPDGRRISLHLDGVASHRDLSTTPPTLRTAQVSLDLSLNDFRGRPAGPVVELRFTTQVPFLGRITWVSGPPLKLQVTLDREQPGAGAAGAAAMPVASAQFIENRDVLLPQNPKHILALSALKLIGAHLNDSSFADAEGLGLFPPPPANAGQQVVRATRDWVLFARRRDIDCGEEAVGLAPGRQYRIYHRHAASLAEVAGAVKTIEDAVTSGDSSQIPGLNLTPLPDLAVFAGGQSALLGRTDLILQDLRAANAGNRLEYCALLSRDATESATLGRARLDNLEQALASLCPADLAHITTEALPRLPAALDVAGIDGAIILITVDAPTICTTLYRAPSNLWDEASKLLQAGNLSSFDNTSAFVSLTSVSFSADSTDMIESPSQLKSAWGVRGPVVAAMLLYKSGTDIGDPAMWRQRVAQMVGLLQSQGILQPQLVAVNNLPPGVNCPVITILVERVVITTCHRAFMLSNNPNLSVPVINLIRKGEFTDALTVPNAVHTLGNVRFAVGTVAPDPTDAALVRTAWGTVAAIFETAVVFYKSGDPTSEQTLLAGRVDAIASAIAGQTVTNVKLQMVGIDFVIPGECPVWTFLVPQGQQVISVGPQVTTVEQPPVVVQSPPVTVVQPPPVTVQPVAVVQPAAAQPSVTVQPVGMVQPAEVQPPATVQPAATVQPSAAARPPSSGLLPIDVTPAVQPAVEVVPLPRAAGTPAARPGPAPTITHTVFAVKSGSRLWRTMLQPLLKKGVATEVTLEELAAKGVLAPLGVMSFAPGQASPTAGASLQKLRSIRWAAGVAIIEPAMFFFQQARPPAPVEVMQQQVKAIQAAVGAPTVGQEPVPAANPPPGGGPILTFIQV